MYTYVRTFSTTYIFIYRSRCLYEIPGTYHILYLQTTVQTFLYFCSLVVFFILSLFLFFASLASLAFDCNYRCILATSFNQYSGKLSKFKKYYLFYPTLISRISPLLIFSLPSRNPFPCQM